MLPLYKGAATPSIDGRGFGSRRVEDGVHCAFVEQEMDRGAPTRRAWLGLVAGAAGALAAPRLARAQARRAAQVGVLLYGTPVGDTQLAGLRHGLRELGYVEGDSLALELRSAAGRPERLRDLAADLARLRPDVIVALGSEAAPFARQASSAVPVVIVTSADPVEAGLVASLTRPGGHVTGVTFTTADIGGKRLQLLREAMPRLTRVAVLWNPDHPDGEFRDTQTTGRALGLSVQSVEARGAEDFDGALEEAVRDKAEALIVVSSRLMTLQQERIMGLAGRYRMMVAGGWGPWAEAGALLAYGADLDLIVRRAANLVDRILRGTRPADLPVEQPTRFRLIVNLRTARTFGLAVPQALLVRADKVIK